MTVRVEYSHALDAPLADAWAVVGDFGSLLSWLRGGSEGSISLSGDGPGMLRDLVLPSVGHVQHRLDVLDDEAHRITYSLTLGKPLGMADYSVSLQLLADEGGHEDERCAMQWAGEFTAAPDADLDDIAAGLEDAYRAMSEQLGELLATARTEQQDKS
jgi:hypothetical protein